MKKFYYSLFAAATMLLATTSCSQDEELMSGSNGKEVQASFTVNLKNAPQSRANAGIGTCVNKLYYAVYEKDGVTKVMPAPSSPNKYLTVDIKDNEAKLTLSLINGESYDIVFWAQSTEASDVYSFTELNEIKVNYNYASNRENLDAFFNTLNDFKASSAVSTTVELRRPFAQLNIGTTVDDWNKAVTVKDGLAPVTSSKVTVTGLADTFNPMTGAATGNVNVEFTEAAIPGEDPFSVTVEKNGEEVTETYKYLALNYLLVPGTKAPQNLNKHEADDPDMNEALTKSLVNVEFTPYSDNEALFTLKALNAPVQRNYRTNIIGAWLTGDMKFDVVIIPEFDGVAENRYIWNGGVKAVTPDANGVYNIYEGTELAWIAQEVNKGTTFEGKTVTLQNDIYLNNTPWTPIGLSTAFKGTFNGNGKTIYDLNITSSISRATTNMLEAVGLFGWLNGTVSNLNLEGVSIDAQTNSGIGSVAGKIFNTGLIEKVNVKDVTIKGNRRIGGIAGYVYGNVKDCSVEKAELTATPIVRADGQYDDGDKVGGIIGYQGEGTYTIENNVSDNVKVVAYRDLGGIAGYVNKDVTVNGNAVKATTVIVNREGIEDSQYDDGQGKAINAGAVLGFVHANAIVTNNGGTADEATTVIGADAEETSAIVNTDDELKNALTAGKKEIVVAGDVKLSTSTGLSGELTFVGTSKESSIDLGTFCSGASSNLNVSFQGLTVKRNSGENYKGFHHSVAETYKDCVIEGEIWLYAPNATFENCTFVQTNSDKYNVWTYGAANVEFNNCTFNSAGKSVLVYNEGAPGSIVTFNNSKFVASTAVEGKAAIEIDGSLLSGTDYYTVNINNTTSTGFAEGSISGNTLWNDKKAKNSLININNGEAVYAYAAKDATLETALKSNAKTIYVTLAENVSLNVSDAYIKLGGENTESITINGNDKTWTWYTTYWSRINLVNPNAKITINDATVTSSQASGTWNSYDVTFLCNVECNNVTFSKAVAIDGGNATLNNCTIAENAGDYYALWICATGNTVNLDGCTIESIGRGIKIDEEYVGSPEKVTLNVTDTSFETAKKAAIMVKTAAGADITLNNVDITKVKADNYNEVWIDEDAAQYADKVTVKGGRVVVEGQIADGVSYDDDTKTYKISKAAGMQWFATQVKEHANTFSGYIVTLTEDINLAGINWEPIGQTGATQFQGTFDGNEKTISNLSIDATAQTGGYYSTGLFGWLNAAVVKNVKVDGATVKGNHNVAVIAGYLETAGCTVENCQVSNTTVECYHANGDACGDKAAIVVGHAGNDGVAVKNCTAKNSTVKAGRDAGQIVGAGKSANVTGCSASNVTVSKLDGCTDSGAGKNIRNEVIGRLL